MYRGIIGFDVLDISQIYFVKSMMCDGMMKNAVVKLGVIMLDCILLI